VARDWRTGAVQGGHRPLDEVLNLDASQRDQMKAIWSHVEELHHSMGQRFKDLRQHRDDEISRLLTPEQRLRYVAVDLSPVMLRRARAEARRRALEQIEFVEADVEALPFADGSFDLGISYTGLHCFPRIDAALAELARVLRPGGVLRGSSVVRGAGIRQDVFVRLAQRAAVFGQVESAAGLEAALASLAHQAQHAPSARARGARFTLLSPGQSAAGRKAPRRR